MNAVLQVPSVTSIPRVRLAGSVYEDRKEHYVDIFISISHFFIQQICYAMLPFGYCAGQIKDTSHRVLPLRILQSSIIICQKPQLKYKEYSDNVP